MTSPHTSSFVDFGSVQILGQVDASLSDSQKVASNKRKATQTKESTKKKPSKSSRSSDEIKVLGAKWFERFSRLEAMLLVKNFQPSTGQPTFQQILMPVSPKKHSPVGALTSDRPFI